MRLIITALVKVMPSVTEVFGVLLDVLDTLGVQLMGGAPFRAGDSGCFRKCYNAFQRIYEFKNLNGMQIEYYCEEDDM